MRYILVTMNQATLEQTHRFTSIEDAKAFALAGNALITLESLRSGAHFTYKIRKPDAEEQAEKHMRSDVWFVKLLTSGSADEGEFTYLGMIRDGQFILTRASKALPSSPSVKALCFFFDSTTLHPELVVRHEMHCGRCGRTLTVPESIDRGIGPECARIMEGGLN